MKARKPLPSAGLALLIVLCGGFGTCNWTEAQKQEFYEHCGTPTQEADGVCQRLQWSVPGMRDKCWSVEGDRADSCFAHFRVYHASVSHDLNEQLGDGAGRHWLASRQCEVRRHSGIRPGTSVWLICHTGGNLP